MTLLKGTLDVVVLKSLTLGPMHPFEITRWIEERSGGELEVEGGALFQAMHRLEERGFVTADWGVTANNRRARYYRITTAGRAHLRAEGTQLARYAEALTSILSPQSRG